MVLLHSEERMASCLKNLLREKCKENMRLKIAVEVHSFNRKNVKIYVLKTLSMQPNLT